MKKATAYFLLTILMLITSQAYAQKTEWIQGFDNHYTINPVITHDDSDNVILACGTRDSFKFKGHTINTATLSYNLIVTKYTKGDSLKWLYSTYASAKTQIGASSVSCDGSFGIYVLVGYTNGNVKLGKNDSLIGTASTTKSALLKFSPNGVLLWYKDFGVIRSTKVKVSQNHVYILNTITNGSSLFCYDTSGNYKFTNTYNNVFLNLSDLVVNETNKNEIYISTLNTKNFTYDSISYSAGTYIFALDTNGKVSNHIRISNSYFFIKFDVDFKHSKKPIYISFNFGDSFTINKDKFNFSGTSKFYSCAFVRVDNFSKVVWEKHTTSSVNSSIQPVGGLKVRGSNIYVYSILQAGSSFIGSVLLQYRSSGFNFCLMKFDSLGNVLWGFTDGTSGATFNPGDIRIDSEGDLYVTGSYLKKIKIFNDSLSNGNKYVEVFMARISDYSISRGKVFAGPYCAGDTIRIPFVKKGEYDTSNIFIAELSDENGSFEGNERELGRIKTNRDSVVIGMLPMFEVTSSGKYRIRTRATKPYVQSFYKLDSLRLLIYSRDKADPGPTETICYGDSFQLSTYGGTKWKWSPKYNMNDSTQRQPWVWPAKATTYKIIIADSSGCGAPDTAYKKIILRKALKLSLAINDTAVCDTSVLKIPMHFEGGDSTNYHWQAFSVSSTKVWQKTKSGKLKLNDTLFHIPKVTITTSQKLAIVLDDECTNKKDTAYVTIQLLNPSELSTKFKDTLLCKGNTISWKAKPVYGLTKNSVWEWRDITNNNVLSTNDSLSVTTKVTSKIKLILTNGCTIDSNVLTLNVNPPLIANILSGKGNLNDTTICLGQSLKLFTKGNGGAGKGYQYSWKVNGSLISTIDSIVLKPVFASNFILTLVLNDNCTIPVDSVSKIVTVVESPKADFSYGAVCNRTNTDFKFTGLIPKSPVTTEFSWNFNNQDSSTNENPSYLFSTPGSKNITISLTSSNGCDDSITKTIEIKPQSKADFSSNDVCETDSAVFINKSQNATGYNWKFGDGLNSVMTTPKHLYNIGGTSKTYNVTLVAISGCSDSVTRALTINANPISDFSFTSSGIRLDLKATQVGNSKYRWLVEKTDSITTISPTCIYMLKTGQKKVCLKVTNLAGCISETCKNVTVGISSIEKPSGFKIYPNPSTGNFTIEIENPSNNVSIGVYDLVGNQIKIVEISPNKLFYSIDLKVANGIYLVRVRNWEKVFNQKVIVGN